MARIRGSEQEQVIGGRGQLLAAAGAKWPVGRLSARQNLVSSATAGTWAVGQRPKQEGGARRREGVKSSKKKRQKKKAKTIDCPVRLTATSFRTGRLA